MNNNEFLKAIGESGAKYILGLIKKNENSIKANTQLLTQVNEKADTAENIAKGRNQAHVFATTADMQTWLSNEENKGLYNVGDNLYIVDVDVPDWWIEEVLDEADAETGYYYKIAQLEVQKVDLSEYLKNTGDTKNNVTTFTSGDSTSPTAWTDVAALATDEKHSSIFNKVSTMFKNIRWLYKMFGTTDISTVGDGTATGAISELNNAIIPETRGGTGQNTLKKSANSLINALATGNSTPRDGDYFVVQYPEGGTENTDYLRRPISNLWSYIKGKLTGAISNILTNNLTKNMALISNSSGKVDASTVTSMELEYLKGVTSNVQEQFKGIANRLGFSGNSSYPYSQIYGPSYGSLREWIDENIGDSYYGEYNLRYYPSDEDIIKGLLRTTYGFVNVKSLGNSKLVIFNCGDAQFYLTKNNGSWGDALWYCDFSEPSLLPTITDIDLIATRNNYRYNLPAHYNSSTKNLPNGANYGIRYVHLHTQGEGMYGQIELHEENTGWIYIRRIQGGVWQQWQVIKPTTL